jgi:DNA-binding LytR/AlgR family response regulator
MKRYVILISGRGSNMESLLDAGLPGQCAVVISNKPDAAGLARAAARGVATVGIDHRGFASREEFDAALAAEIERHAPDRIIATLPGEWRVRAAMEEWADRFDVPVELREDDRVFVREGDRCWFVPLRDIVLLEADGSSTRVYFGNQKPLLPRALTALEARLPADHFFRINRAQIVNLKCIETIEPWFSRSLRVKLKGGMEVEFSRRQALAFRESQGL